MNEETSERPTIKDEPTLRDVLNAVSKLNGRFDKLERETGAQFESIRQGLVDNSARFERLEGNFLLLRAEVTTLIEEVRHNRKVLV